MPVKPAAVLFDLDGTLLDTADDLGAALNAVLAAQQLPLQPAAAYRPLASHGANGLLQLGFGRDVRDAPQLRADFLAHYQADIARYTKPYEGVGELFDALQQQGVKLAIVTNKPAHLTEQLLPYYPEFSAIEVVVCGDTLRVAKPHPEPLLLAAQQLQVAPQGCWYVGDAERDIRAGHNAGMYTVLAEYGYIHADDRPDSWRAHARIATPLALLGLLAQVAE